MEVNIPTNHPAALRILQERKIFWREEVAKYHLIYDQRLWQRAHRKYRAFEVALHGTFKCK